MSWATPVFYNKCIKKLQKLFSYKRDKKTKSNFVNNNMMGYSGGGWTDSY